MILGKNVLQGRAFSFQGDAMSVLTPESELGQSLAQERLIAVLIIDEVASAVPLARALLAGGVRVMELTWRTDAALDSMKAIRAAVPEMVVGLGTLLDPEQAVAAAEAGAHFGVSPGVNVEVIRAAHGAGLPFGPGVMTPTDIDTALREGCRILKFFPAESSGGLSHLRNIAAPFLHMGPKFVPLGGVSLTNVKSYLAEPLVAAVGGSWLAPRDLVREGEWGRIEELAREARSLVEA